MGIIGIHIYIYLSMYVYIYIYVYTMRINWLNMIIFHYKLKEGNIGPPYLSGNELRVVPASHV